ncbi:ABC transporter ATP-binding protein [Actinotignum schaalii]|uniref:ABC transporter ATP-binding protein n=1 Tax=Actinotignum schaalii TaxID=59505 RepID=UPI0003FEC685|nr:ABC transporter ATP-binding protein [Actinotignum schaalii]AIE83142.1 ABC transporter [Actinotignum schaalii]WQN45318.1 ABC transporter ATP-binding protein [Actinotignum schaalii]
MLELRDVSVRYPDGFEAVRGVNLSVESGTTVALLGASGSGKSSLLRGIAGLEAVRGQVLIDGADMTAVPTHRRGVGMVFQDGQLFPNRSVGGNIAYGIEKGRSRAEVAAEVERWLELVELSGYAKRAVTTLSGGQAQRVALARSLAARPRVLLLDEPLSALDTRLREDLAVFLRRVLQKAGTTAVYVTHNDAEAATVADRVVRMDSGRLVAVSE